jgi:hypothetical protein
MARPGAEAIIKRDVPGRKSMSWLVFVSDKDEVGRGAAIRCDVSDRLRQCFSLCSGLCLSQIKTSSVTTVFGSDR